MMRKLVLLVSLLIALGASGQKYKSSWMIENNPSDLSGSRRSIDLSMESYLYDVAQSFWAGRLSMYYSFGKKRNHMAGATIPLLISDYSGTGTKIGLGDLYFGYYYYPYRNYSGNKAVQAVGIGLTAFAPTGNEQDGLGRGDWVMVLNALMNWRLSPRWAIYPSARYLVSFDSTYSKSIAIPPGNVPEPPSVEPAQMVSSIQCEAQVVYEMPKAGAWLMLAPEFSYDFNHGQYSMGSSLRIGKMFNNNFGLSFTWSTIFAGEKTFSNAFQLNIINYFKNQ